MINTDIFPSSFSMVWREILNTGVESENDPTHADEVYGVPVIVGSNLIAKVVDNLWELNDMIEIRKQVRVQFWRAMFATSALVIELDEAARKAGEENLCFKLFIILRER